MKLTSLKLTNTHFIYITKWLNYYIYHGSMHTAMCQWQVLVLYLLVQAAWTNMVMSFLALIWFIVFTATFSNISCFEIRSRFLCTINNLYVVVIEDVYPSHMFVVGSSCPPVLFVVVCVLVKGTVCVTIKLCLQLSCTNVDEIFDLWY